MHIVAVGLTHRTAPVEIREQFALSSDEQAALLAALLADEAAKEAVVISTCNRTEVYATGPGFHAVAAAVKAALSQCRPEMADKLSQWLEEYYQVEAVRHLFRVASGLDSQVLGETQVLGQVREAYRAAVNRNATATLLDTVFQQALATGKRVHSETGISRVPVSIGSAAVDLARDKLGTLSGVTALLVGAGEMAQLTARHVRAAGAGRIMVANRTAANAKAVAREIGGEPVPWAELGRALSEADVVITGTASTKPVLTVAELQQVAAQRRSQPLLIIDIAVPRDVEPAAAAVPGVMLFDIDDLKMALQAGQREREAEAKLAEAIVSEEVDRFAAWLHGREVVPVIQCLFRKAEEMRTAELRRLFNRLPDLTVRERQLIEAMTSSLVGKMLSDPTLRLKEFAAAGGGRQYAEALSRLFNLGLDDQFERAEEVDDE